MKVELAVLIAMTTCPLLVVGCRDAAVDAGTPDEKPSRLSLQPLHASVRSFAVGALCVDRGKFSAQPGERGVNRSPLLRATAPNSGGQYAAVTFRYLGKAAHDERLGTEVERQQLGLRLLHRNACNTVHVSWRVSERSFVLASIQSNPDVTPEAECEHQGQRDLRPFWREPVDAPEAGSTHELAATIRHGLLEVRVDERPVLRAVVAGHRVPASGSSGLRSDNVQFELLHFQADRLLASIAPTEGCPG